MTKAPTSKAIPGKQKLIHVHRAIVEKYDIRDIISQLTDTT